MKTIIPGERFEERRSPMCWFWLTLAILWLAQTALRIAQGAFGYLLVLNAICAVLCLVNFILYTRYLLIADENGVVFRYGLSRTRTLRWDEIVRVTDREQNSFRRSAGIRLYTAAQPDKEIFIGPRSELLPIVKRYSPVPVEFEG